MKINIVVPMAGLGSRFRDAGYRVPKPFIKIGDKTMIELVYENLKPKKYNYEFIFICRSEHLPMMRKIFRGKKVKLVSVDEVTKGALCTTLFAREYIDSENPMLIAACDQLVDIYIDDFLDYSAGLDGCLMTFYCNKDNHSYSKVRFGKVVEVAEKKVISKNSNVGIYYFGNGISYCTAAEKMLDLKDTFNGEYYVAPVYNHLIGRNIKIYNVDKDKIHTVGTPFELRQYVNKIK